MASHIQEDELTMSSEELLQAQLDLYHHCFVYVKSMALGAATDLRIPDAIHLRGGAATLSDLARSEDLPDELSHLRRLMRVLTTSVSSPPMSTLVATQHTSSPGLASSWVWRRAHAAMTSRRWWACLSTLSPSSLSSKIREWFTDEKSTASSSLFEVAPRLYRRWEMIAKDAGDDRLFNAGMAADSHLSMGILLKECNNVFGSMGSSLVDVGGAHGTATAIIAKAFPHVKCTVLDLPRVVAGAPALDNVIFVPGDMFESIPPADTVLLKTKIASRYCVDAKPSRKGRWRKGDNHGYGGRFCRAATETVSKAEVLFDVFMMYIDGIQRGA
ncbi:hypothetical protein ZWY2020_055144 [Hordeum vulgare]|nr:hypothetical protein ZWY2020_055144 [Hordeum vulgare]